MVLPVLVAVLVIASFLLGACGNPRTSGCPGHSLIHFLKEAVVLPVLVAVLVIASFLIGGCCTSLTGTSSQE